MVSIQHSRNDSSSSEYESDLIRQLEEDIVNEEKGNDHCNCEWLTL